MKLFALMMGLAALGSPVVAQVAPNVAAARQDLAPDGRLKIAINTGNAVLAAQDPVTGKLSGVSVDLARQFGGELGVPVDLVPFVSAGQTFDAVDKGAWVVAFLAIDPKRAEKITYTSPYLVIEGSYLVNANGPFHAVGDLDRDGVRIAVARGSAYDLYLSRTLKHATLVRAVTTRDAIALFQSAHLDASAGIRQALAPWAAANPALVVLPGRFMRIEQAVAVPKGHDAGAAFAQEFIARELASGGVAKALADNKQDVNLAAPPAQ